MHLKLHLQRLLIKLEGFYKYNCLSTIFYFFGLFIIALSLGLKAKLLFPSDSTAPKEVSEWRSSFVMVCLGANSSLLHFLHLDCR